MFIGHFGVAFGAKSAAPRTSLGTLFLAAQFVDVLWPTLLLLGIETVLISPGITPVTPLDFVSYPWSHSLAFSFVWAGLFAAIYAFVRRYAAGAIVAGVCVISHWFLDLIVHRPDLPLTPSGITKVGFGAWSSLPLTMLLEFTIFIAGLHLYMRTTKAKDRTGSWALWFLAAFLGVIYLSNVFGPPPPSAGAIAWLGQAQWLLVAFGYWIDRHRTTATEPASHRPRAAAVG